MSLSAVSTSLSEHLKTLSDDALADRMSQFKPGTADYILGQHELNRRLQDKGTSHRNVTTMSDIKIFISHSSKDETLADALAELFRNALGLPPQQIRCTSVDAYRLSVGVKTDAELQREIREAATFVGVITAASIESAYVLFELGARWGTDKFLAPLLGGSADNSYLRGPLVSYNALRCDNAAQLHRVIENLATQLEMKAHPPFTYENYVQRVISASLEIAARQPKPSKGSPTESAPATAEPKFSSQALDFLRQLVRSDAKRVMLIPGARDEIHFKWVHPKVSEPKFVREDFESLYRAGLLSQESSPNGHAIYLVTRKGEAFVKDLIESDPTGQLSEQAKDIVRQLVGSDQRRVITSRDGFGELSYSLLQDPQLVFSDGETVDDDFQSLVDVKLMREDYTDSGDKVFILTAKGVELGQSLQ
jgi:predicted transcriptional regulator